MFYIPFLAYWLTCGFLSLFNIGKSDDYQISNRNSVKKLHVFKNVFMVTLSTILGNFLLEYFEIFNIDIFRWYYILVGIWWIDTVEYFLHILMHKVQFLYRLMHKEHHKLQIPYSYGALYNSTPEAISTSTFMLLGFYFLGISYKEFIVVTTLANIATVIDHTDIISYKKRFHYLHHSAHQNCNFQQPFFTYYDRLFGTYKV